MYDDSSFLKEVVYAEASNEVSPQADLWSGLDFAMHGSLLVGNRKEFTRRNAVQRQ